MLGAQPLLRIGIDRQLPGLAVHLGDGRLVHHRNPEIAVTVELEIERALGLLGPHHRDVVVDDLAGLGIEHAHDLRAEVGVPGLAVGIDDDVVRIGVLPRQVVFGDDHAWWRGPSAAALRLELVFLGLRIGQADVDQELRRRLRDLGIDARALAAGAAADEQLRLRRRRARIVAAHPVEHLDPFVDVVLRGEQPLQGVAAGAAGEELLVAVGAGEALPSIRRWRAADGCCARG